MTAITAWCKCGHTTHWHKDGGACTYWSTSFDGADTVPVVCDAACSALRLEHIEVVG